MAEVLVKGRWVTEHTEVNFGPTERVSKYPWDRWLNGRVWRLTFDRDFNCSIASLRTLISNQQSRRGIQVRTEKISPDVLEIESLGMAHDLNMKDKQMLAPFEESLHWVKVVNDGIIENPWKLWSNRTVWILTKGKEFTCSVESMQSYAQAYAKQEKLRVKTVADGSRLVVQFTK